MYFKSSTNCVYDSHNVCIISCMAFSPSCTHSQDRWSSNDWGLDSTIPAGIHIHG